MFGKFFRLMHINIILLKYGLDRILWTTPLFRPFFFLIIFFPWRWFRKSDAPNGESIRCALEELGPIFVKFGQLLSTRRDLLPDEISDELAKLQDSVPPFKGEIAQKIIEKTLQQSVASLFLDFNIMPLASASIAQVHAATLQDGTPVVVKVLRPNIARQIKRDVDLMRLFAKLIHRTLPKMRRFRPVEVVEEINRTLMDELDLLREAANASQLRRNFTDSQSLYVPQVFWPLTRSNILIIERIHGIPISNISALKANQVDLKRLAEKGVEIFFTQVFRDCFFHADMHPGNIFVTTEDPENARYIAIDFGIMGTLGPEDQRYLGENFLAFFKRDYRRVAELHVQSGWVPPNTPLNAFESAIRTVCEPIFERPLYDISFGQTLLRLFQTARRFDMEVQPQLLLLQKTLLNIEGLGRQLYPELDLWQTAKPYLEKWMKEQYGFKAFFKKFGDKLPLWSDKLPELPEAIYDVARFWQHETHRLSYQASSLSDFTKPLSKEKKRFTFSRQLLGATLILCATLIAISSPLRHLIHQYDIWIVSIGVGVGLFCIFKN